MALIVYNTLTRKKEPFEPLTSGRVGIYLCGPTVYKPSHIGHGNWRTHRTLPLRATAAAFRCAPPRSQPRTMSDGMAQLHFDGARFAHRIIRPFKRLGQPEYELRGIQSDRAAQPGI